LDIHLQNETEPYSFASAQLNTLSMKKARIPKVLVTSLIFFLVSVSDGKAQTPMNAGEEQQKNQVIHLAKLRIDSSQLKPYLAKLKEEIETSVRIEPGVLTLYATSEKNNPTHIIVFEIYANAEAYKAHMESPHFKKYKSTTKEMVKSLELVDLDPVILGIKSK
jgi:quinol monooxygenase YgiN